MATSVAAIVLAAPPRSLGGTNILGPIIQDDEDFPRTLFWRRNKGNHVRKAVRDHDLKYIYQDDDGTLSEYQLDLLADPGEPHTRRQQNPDALRTLKTRLVPRGEVVPAERYEERAARC